MAIPKRLTPTCISTMSLLCISLTLPGEALAATYWVSPTGAAAWASCSGATPLSGTSACALGTANSNAAAGDTVYLRGGTYTIGLYGQGIDPINSGSAGTPPLMITFAAYTGETPVITGGSYTGGFVLEHSNNYIRIQGITFGPLAVVGDIYHGSHNELANNIFQATTGGGIGIYVGSDWSPPYTEFSTNNWIHNNQFIWTGQANGDGGLGCTDGGGDNLNIGHAYEAGLSSVDNDNYNTVENNIFDHAPHANLDQYGMYNVYRNNVFHNEPWSAGCTSTSRWAPTYSSSNPNYTAYNGSYGHRNFQISEDYGRTGLYLLIEGNRSGYASMNQGNGGADNFDLAAPGNIARYNFLYASMNSGLTFKYGWNNGPGGGGNGSTYNRVYNNTIYNSGYGYPLGLTVISGNNSSPIGETNVDLSDGANSGLGNVFKNNLLYSGGGYATWGLDVLSGYIYGTSTAVNGWSLFATVANNWCSGVQTGSSGTTPAGACTGSGDPKFTNPDLTNPASTTLPDLSLQSSSGAIDGGTNLTTATNSGTGSTTLTVADALYFQDGTWGSDLARASTGLGGTFQADWIAIGTVSNVVQISSISYGTYNNPAGTITLASPMTWSNGASIWLYKKSDGAVVLAGAAPDIGASEYIGRGGTVAPPTNLQTVVR